MRALSSNEVGVSAKLWLRLGGMFALTLLAWPLAEVSAQQTQGQSLFQNGHMGGNCAQCHETSTLPRYEFDRAQSKVVYTIEAYGFEAAGVFRAIGGGFVFDPGHPEQSSVIATIETASVDSGDGALDSLIKSSRLLDAGQYPVMSYRSSAVEVLENGEFSVSGVLSLAGHEQPLTLTVHPVGVAMDLVTGRRTAGFVARGEITRSDFGLRLGLPAIADRVQFTIYAAGDLLE